MPSTTYKGYTVPTTGTETNTWGDELNDNFTAVADRNMGGIVAKSLSSSNVALSSTESQYLILRLTGTLSANVQVTTSAQGMTIVENLTSGAFTVTFNNGAGTPVALPQGARSLVATDASNGPRIAAGTFESGTPMLFFSAAAPVGWTKSTTHNNKAIRLVSGTGGASGGTIAFTTAFASQTPAGTVGNTTLTINQIPAHTHGTYSINLSASTTTSSGPYSDFVRPDSGSGTTQSSGGGQSHTHTFTGSAMDLAVQYVDALICTKD